MKLYGNPGSTCTRKVLTLLAERGVEATFVNIDLGKGEQKSPEHLARHPFGVIPVFEESDGFRIYESRAILRHLDRTLPGARLTPEDPRRAARMDQWLSVEQSYFSGPVLTILKAAWGRPGFGPQQVADATPNVARALDVADRALAETGAYFAGDAFSLADISWMPYVDYLVKTPSGALVAERPAFAAWWERVKVRAAWRKVAG
jgi:glutathione S-transferase